MSLLNVCKKVALLIIVTVLIFASACQNKKPKNNEWKELFDGKTLNGWKVINQDWDNPESIPDDYLQYNIG